MANTSNKKAKLIFGYFLISFSLILFILACIPNFVVSNIFKGVFGIAGYVYLVLLFLLGIANILNLKYMYSKKFTVCMFFALFALISLLHMIFSHSALVSWSGFDSIKDYISYCFSLTNGATVGGAIFASIVYSVKTCTHIIGAYSIFIMMLSIFTGVVLDALIYGNAKAKKQQKLDTKMSNSLNVAPKNIAPKKEESLEETIKNTNYIDENAEIDNNSYYQQPNYNNYEQSSNSVRSQAQNTLFPERDFTPYTSQNQNQSARDILFGRRDIPDVTMPDDLERDRWMRNTAQELSREDNLSLGDDNEDPNDIFGNTGLNIANNDDDLYSRGFPTRNISREVSASEPSRFGTIRNARIPMDDEDNKQDDLSLNRDIPNSRLMANRDVINSNNKLGELENDIAKPYQIDFSAPQKPVKPVSKPVQGKQMGIKSVRYNSIPLSIFKVYEEKNADYSEEYRRKTAALEKVMRDFKIGAKVINVVRGPKVTRYELTLPDGVSVGKVLAIETDISMAIEAKSKIRIEAPIPGKKAFGIELENDVCSTVGMRELLESPEFTKTTAPLPIAIGKDINGNVIIKSLPKMIHLLVAGSSGSGKSVFIHALMMSILYKYSPEDVRFIMIDPKRVEFSMYRNLPHLMLPDVVSDHDKALNAIKWCVQEMDRRYIKLQSTECQNIEQYNKLPEITSGKEQKMPYLVIVVDELAELMGGALKKDFEAGIQRITQLGRAAGIHMVVATQRPSVDVVTGTIKNNMSTRIAFALASFADSKTVLDEGGAENLLGQGDMLFAPQDQNLKTRLQAAFCSNDEIRNALKYVKENNEAYYDEEVMKEIYAEKKEESSEGTDALGNGGGPVNNNNGMDEYMKLAVQFARSTGKVSASMLQRKFRIGFTRAARIVDQMIELGLVGPAVGAKPRDFSISDELYRELFGEDDQDNIF